MNMMDLIVLSSLFVGIVWCIYIVGIIIYRLFFDREWREIMKKEDKEFVSKMTIAVLTSLFIGLPLAIIFLFLQ